MKTLEELLENIEDDMELMGEDHIIYLMEQDGEVVDYDYFPGSGCNEAVTLKNLRTELLIKLHHGNVTDTKKLAVIFPGIGYTCDRPLLYYTEKFVKSQGYETVRVTYGELPKDVKGDPEKKREAVMLAYAEVCRQLADIHWEEYSDVLFVSKSIGTVISTRFAFDKELKVSNILFTPVEQTFKYAAMPAVAFHGLADDWCDSKTVQALSKEKDIPMYTIKDANHSLETGDIRKDILNLQKVMEDVQHFILK